MVLEMKKESGMAVMVGGVYIRPNRDLKVVDKWLEGLERCDIVMGDFNARDLLWGKEGGDMVTNQYGPRVRRWMILHGYKHSARKKLTFRDISIIDLTLAKGRSIESVVMDKTGLEHSGQMIKLRISADSNIESPKIAYRKVDWNKLADALGIMEGTGEEMWVEMRRIVDALPKAGVARGKCTWWTEKLERMAKDVKCLRRRGEKEMWKVARAVFRKTVIQARYEWMKERLSKAKDPDIYKMIMTLEARRTVPPLISGDGTKLSNHEEMAECFGSQLNPVPEGQWTRDEISLDVDEDELGRALKASPGNTAGGIDGMSYPLLRFFWKKHKGEMMEMVRGLVRTDTEDWHKSSCVLIKKGDKDRYDVAKSWRMIHLLPCMAKVTERVILAKLAKTVTLEESQFGSRKRRSTSDAMKVILDFMEYHKGMKCGMITMDVEGGFDKVNVDILSDILAARGCSREVNL